MLIIKLLGAVYKIPVGNLLGDDGYGLFMSAYNVYNVFLMLATAGFPVALSRMISAAQSRPMLKRRIFSVSLCAFAFLGAVCSMSMFFYPEQIAALLKNPDASLSIKALSPSVILVCMTSAYRGYVQGHENMIPTSVGEVIEVLVKVVVGLSLAWILTEKGYNKAAASAGAIFGVTAGSAAVLSYMAITKARLYRNHALSEPDIPPSRGQVLKELLSIAVPIALGSVILALVNLLDSALCMARLQDGAGFDYDSAKVLYGVYGKAQSLFNLPAAFITPLTISVVPAISAKLSQGDRAQAGRVAADSLRISMLLGMPMGAGLAVLAGPIMATLYPTAHESGAALLTILGMSSILVCFALMTTALLQAEGLERKATFSIAVGGAVKLALNWLLIADPRINIYGAALGTVACYAVMSAVNLHYLKQTLPERVQLLAPTAAAAFMAASAHFVYSGCKRALSLPLLPSLVTAVLLSALVYLLLTAALKAVSIDDLKLIPNGEKLAERLGMRKK